MSTFEIAFAATLKNEGFPGYNIDNNKAEVCAGINRAYWPGWGGWPQIDVLKAKGLDKAGINAALKKDTTLIDKVTDFYRRNFWLSWMEQLNDQALANYMYDHCVNAGFVQPVKWLQRALNIADDGKAGPQTVRTVNAAADPAALVKSCHDQAVKFYQGLHAKDPAKYPADMVNRA